MGNLRVDYFGLIATVIHDEQDQLGTAAKKVTLLFPDPSSDGLDAHIPRIELSDANVVDWGRTTLTPEPNVSPLTFSLKGWHVDVRPDDAPPAQMVTFPPVRFDPADPSGIRVWDTPERFLDMRTICGGADDLNDDFFDAPGSASLPKELMGRFAIGSGSLHTVSLRAGNFEKWRFRWQGGIVHLQEAAGHFSSIFSAKKFVMLSLTNLATGKAATLAINCPDEKAVTIDVKHTCQGTCADHKGKHVKMYYKMMAHPARTPDPEFQFTDASYCPPGRFVRKVVTDLSATFISA